MLILVVGAKGGVGTTSLALHLARAGNAVGLDLADGQLAVLLERRTWTLDGLAFTTEGQRRKAIDEVVNRRLTLLWVPECALALEQTWGFVRAVADRCPVVADGGINPPSEIDPLADEVVIVSAEDNPVAQYHEQRLRRRFPDAIAIPLNLGKSRRVIKNTAEDLAGKIFGDRI